MKIPQIANVPDSVQAIAQTARTAPVAPHDAIAKQPQPSSSDKDGVRYERAEELAAWMKHLNGISDTRDDVVAEVKQRMSDVQRLLDRSTAERVADRILGDS